MTLTSAGGPWTANLFGLLAPEERAACVEYAAVQPVASGEPLQFARSHHHRAMGRVSGLCRSRSHGHRGHLRRYILISRAPGEIRSIEARYLPFAEKRFTCLRRKGVHLARHL